MDAKFVRWECSCIGIKFSGDAPYDHVVLVDYNGDPDYTTETVFHRDKPGVPLTDRELDEWIRNQRRAHNDAASYRDLREVLRFAIKED